MYQLTVKETYGSKAWSLNLGDTAPRCPAFFNAGRDELKLAAIFFPDNSLKSLFTTILKESSQISFSFNVAKLSVEETQTVAIFKGMDVIPESGRELVLHMATGQFLAPAIYKKSCGHFHTPGGDARPYMIKEWAYQDELNQILGLEPVDPETLEQLNKRADADNPNTRFNPEKLFDALADAISEIFPEAKVQVRKS